MFKEGQKQGEITDFRVFGGGVSKNMLFFFAQSAPSTPRSDENCSKKWDLPQNYDVKLSTSKIQNRPKLVQSHKPPNQVVRMLVISMKNNI